MIIYDALWRKFELEQIVQQSNGQFTLDKCDEYDINMLDMYFHANNMSYQHLKKKSPEGIVTHLFYIKE